MASRVLPGPVAHTTSWVWPRASLLHAALSSAATYTELARVCRTWSADRIEAVVQRRLAASRSSPSDSLNGMDPPIERKKSFYALRDGATLKQYRVDMIQGAFPRSNILLWWKHPLAEILCNPQLRIDEILELLRGLPRGQVKDLVWQKVVVPTPGFSTLRLTEWTPSLVRSLSRITTDVSLFAILARLRMEQLLGNVDGGSEAVQAAWNILPYAMERRPHLLVSKKALILALDYFSGWQPFADTRLFQEMGLGVLSRRMESLLRCEKIWLKNTSIPGPVKQLRQGLVHWGLVPEVLDHGWWRMWGSLAEIYDPTFELKLARKAAELSAASDKGASSFPP